MKKALAWLLTILGGLGVIAAKIVQGTEWYYNDKMWYLWSGDDGYIHRITDASLYIFVAILVLGILFLVLNYIKANGTIKPADVANVAQNVAGELKGKVQSVVKTGAVAMGKVSFCKFCGKEVSPHDNYCRHCNGDLQAKTNDSASDISSTENAEEKMYCTSCGNAVSCGSTFCNKCGTKTEVTQ